MTRSSSRYPLNRLLALILLANLGIGCTAASAAATPESGTPKPVHLFSDTARGGNGVTTNDPTIIRTRFVDVNLDLLTGPAAPAGSESATVSVLLLNLFPDVSFTAVLDHVEKKSNGLTWIGHVEGVPTSQVTLVIEDKAMAGSITVSGKFYQVRYVGNSVHAIYQINQATFPPD